ncbi:hypothetical protein C5S32_00470, partial [ANME-1 cluster archaeon GoMg1]|nr:hypothetical protein [ANME-1 cluster archaeon GoMg1]
MKITALGLAVLTILAVTALLPIAIAQEVPAHVVISEVLPNPTGTEDGKEYVELYNPTNIEIDIGGWVIDTKSDTDADATIPHGAKIQVHGFYLVGDTPWTPEAGWPTSPDHEEEIALANNEGWVRLRKNLGGNIVDTVGWGTATTNETLNAAKPADGESIERKSLNGGYAPCQDTDDNSFDFSVQGTPTPKNSASPEMDPAPVELFDAAGNFKGGFNKIQDAVNNAADGDTVLVHDGTYNENVDVTKSHLTIRSEHGPSVTTVSASLNPDEHVFDIT